MKIVAFAGSNSSTSINLALVKYTCAYLKECEIDLLNLNDFDMPLYAIDKERATGIPAAARSFINKIQTADALVISLAEHNRSYTVAFKNILDWCSRAEKSVFANKKMLLMSTSPGGYGGGNVMAEALKFFPQFGADIVAHFSLPKFNENFDANSGITDPAIKADFEAAVQNFISKL